MKTHYLEYIQNSIVTAWNMPGLTNYKKNSYTYGEISQHVARHHILFEKLGLKKATK